MPELPVNPLEFLEAPAVALLVVYLVTSVIAFIKGWIVPRYMYDNADERGRRAIEALESQTKAVEELTKEVRFRK